MFQLFACLDFQAAVGFLGHFGGAVGWACELPTLGVSMVTLVLALERQDFAGGIKASKQVLILPEAIRVFQQPQQKSNEVLFFRSWWKSIPSVLRV